jgi:uncharacterized membrane protein YjjB (DUF3815 family)
VTLSVPAVVIMVPGVTAMRAIFEFNGGNWASGLGLSVDAALVVIALSVGLAGARMLTDPEWTFETRRSL